MLFILSASYWVFVVKSPRVVVVFSCYLQLHQSISITINSFHAIHSSFLDFMLVVFSLFLCVLSFLCTLVSSTGFKLHLLSSVCSSQRMKQTLAPLGEQKWNCFHHSVRQRAALKRRLQRSSAVTVRLGRSRLTEEQADNANDINQRISKSCLRS